jgi:hypothetical protein
MTKATHYSQHTIDIFSQYLVASGQSINFGVNVYENSDKRLAFARVLTNFICAIGTTSASIGLVMM